MRNVELDIDVPTLFLLEPAPAATVSILVIVASHDKITRLVVSTDPGASHVATEFLAYTIAVIPRKAIENTLVITAIESGN